MPSRGLGDVTARALTRPGAGSALLAALGVYAAFTLASALRTLVGIGLSASYGGGSGPHVGQVLVGALTDSLIRLLPFAIGVFLAFWQIAPIAPQLRMAHVVTRAVLAALLGVLFGGVVTFLVGIGVQVSLVATVYPSLGAVGDSLRASVSPTVDLLFDALIAVPLAALLLWGWLQSHAPKSTARGALDEV